MQWKEGRARTASDVTIRDTPPTGSDVKSGETGSANFLTARSRDFSSSFVQPSSGSSPPRTSLYVYLRARAAKQQHKPNQNKTTSTER